MTDREIAKEIRIHIQALKDLKQAMKENNTIKTLQKEESDLRIISKCFDGLSIQANEKGNQENATEFQSKADEYYIQAKECEETLNTLTNIITSITKLDTIELNIFN